MRKRGLHELGWYGSHIVFARSFYERLRGIAPFINLCTSSRTPIPAFPHCCSVYTCFMRLPLDIAFLESTGRVVARYMAVPSGQFFIERHAAMVLERFTPALSSE